MTKPCAHARKGFTEGAQMLYLSYIYRPSATLIQISSASYCVLSQSATIDQCTVRPCKDSFMYLKRTFLAERVVASEERNAEAPVARPHEKTASGILGI